MVITSIVVIPIISIIILLLIQTVIATPDFEFAYINNTLYYNINFHFYGRGYQILYGLLGIQNHYTIPNIYGSIGHLSDDRTYDLHTFGFWNERSVSYLLPEFDFWGHVDFRLPPHQYLFDALQVYSPSYSERINKCFWTGTVRQRGYLRGMFLNCPSPNLELIVYPIKDVELHSSTLIGHSLTHSLTQLLAYSFTYPLIHTLSHL